MFNFHFLRALKFRLALTPPPAPICVNLRPGLALPPSPSPLPLTCGGGRGEAVGFLIPLST